MNQIVSQEDIRSDKDKQLEQEQISLSYQTGVSKRRGQRDGVVVTPCEVVDFQIKSVLAQLAAMNREPDKGVEWLDPFGGSGIYTARLLQIVDLPPERKRVLAGNCIVVEIDPEAAQIAADNLARVYQEECGTSGAVRVICCDTFSLEPNTDLWNDELVVVPPRRIKGSKHDL